MTDATKLTFPLQLVVLIVATMGGVYASNYTSKAADRDDRAKTASDIRDILTRLELGSKVAEAQSKADDERFTALRTSIESQSKETKEALAAVQRRQEMQQIQISQLSEAVAKLSSQQRGK